MGKHIFEEGPRAGHAAGDTSDEQAASQLVSDIKYKVRQKLKSTSGSNLSPAQVQGEYKKLFAASSASGAVKAIAKKKLFGEQVDLGILPVSEHVKGSTSYVYSRVFLEADEPRTVRVTDRATRNTRYVKADRAKVSELRKNTNIASVEYTGHKADLTDAEKASGGKKAKKDYDGDGKIESGKDEYMGSRDKAIKKAMAAKRTRKEEVIYETDENGEKEKKFDVLKGKNKVIINPKLGEQKEVSPDDKKQIDLKKKILQKKMMLQKQTMQMQKQGKLALNYNEACEKCDGDHDTKDHDKKKDIDPRSNYAMMNVTKNKLRAMGLKMSYDMEGESIDEVTYPSDFIDKKTGKKKAVATSKTGRPQQHDEPMSGGRRKTVDETADLDQMQKDADANRARAAKLKDRNVTRGSASFAAAKAADTVKKAAKYGPQQHKGTRTGVMRVEETEDSLRDRRQERGGVDGNTRYDRASKAPNTKKFGSGKTMAQKEMEKKYGKGATAMDVVKAQIRAKHGKGAIKD